MEAMTNQDTYSTHPETHLATALANAARNELATCMREQRLLPWLEIDELVSKDEVRLFNLIEDSGGYVLPKGNHLQSSLFGDAPKLERISQDLADHLGFLSTSNLRAMLNRVVDKGWVTQSECRLTGGLRFDMTQAGRYYYDCWLRERYFDEMEDV